MSVTRTCALGVGSTPTALLKRVPAATELAAQLGGAGAWASAAVDAAGGVLLRGSSASGPAGQLIAFPTRGTDCSKAERLSLKCEKFGGAGCGKNSDEYEGAASVALVVPPPPSHPGLFLAAVTRRDAKLPAVVHAVLSGATLLDGDAPTLRAGGQLKLGEEKRHLAFGGWYCDRAFLVSAQPPGRLVQISVSMPAMELALRDQLNLAISSSATAFALVPASGVALVAAGTEILRVGVGDPANCMTAGLHQLAGGASSLNLLDESEVQRLRLPVEATGVTSVVAEPTGTFAFAATQSGELYRIHVPIGGDRKFAIEQQVGVHTAPNLRLWAALPGGKVLASATSGANGIALLQVCTSAACRRMRCDNECKHPNHCFGGHCVGPDFLPVAQATRALAEPPKEEATAVAQALPPPPPSPAEFVCGEAGGHSVCGYPRLECRPAEGTPDQISLAFDKASVVASNLGGTGGASGLPSQEKALRIGKVGKAADGGDVDLVVTNTSEYTPLSPAANTLSEGFGQINVATGTSVALRFALVATGTNTPVTAARLDFSLFDFDKGSGTSEREETMVPSSSYSAYTVDLDSQLHVMADAVTTTVRATKQSSSANIDDPKALDAEERARTIQFTFRDVSSWAMTFKVPKALGGGGGGNFLFSGASMARQCPAAAAAGTAAVAAAAADAADAAARAAAAADALRGHVHARRQECDERRLLPGGAPRRQVRRRYRLHRLRPHPLLAAAAAAAAAARVAVAAARAPQTERPLRRGGVVPREVRPRPTRRHDRRPAVRRQPDRRRRGPLPRAPRRLQRAERIAAAALLPLLRRALGQIRRRRARAHRDGCTAGPGWVHVQLLAHRRGLRRRHVRGARDGGDAERRDGDQRGDGAHARQG